MHSNIKVSQRRDFDLGLHASHHLKNNPPKWWITKRWDKKLAQEILPEGRIIDTILHIEGYLHIFTFYSTVPSPLQVLSNVSSDAVVQFGLVLEHFFVNQNQNQFGK